MTRHTIGINILYRDMVTFETKLKDITIQDVAQFNPKHAHIVGVAHDLDYMRYCIYLVHTEFPQIPEGCCVPKYSLAEARRQYPYLFYDTNPLLYRKFGHFLMSYPKVTFFSDKRIK